MDRFTPGQELKPGQSLASPNTLHNLAFQGDGNVVLYTRGRAVWSTGTSGTAANQFVMQGDGNLVLYEPGKPALWNSGTPGKGLSTLILQDDRNLVIYSAAGPAIWDTDTWVTDRLEPGEELKPGGQLRSGNRSCFLAFQGDGNVVVYTRGRVVWSTGTSGTAANQFVMQGDGNLVLYEPGKPALWNSGTPGKGLSTLILQGDRNLVIYPTAGPSSWNSGTNETDRLEPGEELKPGGALKSANGYHVLAFQADGNVVLYSLGRAVWSTGTSGTAANQFVMQGDGNLVLYEPGKPALWNSGTPGKGLSTLILQDDRNLVIYPTAGPSSWNSGTVEPLEFYDPVRVEFSPGLKAAMDADPGTFWPILTLVCSTTPAGIAACVGAMIAIAVIFELINGKPPFGPGNDIRASAHKYAAWAIWRDRPSAAILDLVSVI